MLIVRVELHSAITGEITEIARMHIANCGDSPTITLGIYDCITYKGRDSGALDNCLVSHEGEVLKYHRLSSHVWNLVARCLAAMNYK